MSRTELYSWTSLVSSGALALYYLIAVIGFPGADAPMAEGLKGPLLKVFGWAVFIEVLIGILRSTPRGRVEKDERDARIEGRAFRNAYFFLVVVVVGLLGHVVAWRVIGASTVTASGLVMFHTLVMALLLASVVNSGSKLFQYMWGS